MQPEPATDDKANELLGKLLGEIRPGAPLQGLPESEAASDNPQVMQALTASYITTMYYSALANLYLQSRLPEDAATIETEMPRFKILFNRTYTDFTTAAHWLAQYGSEFIATSPAKSYYDEVTALEEGTVIRITDAYAKRT